MNLNLTNNLHKSSSLATPCHVFMFFFRNLSRDSNNGMHQLVLGIMRKIGVMTPSEEFDSETLKTKMIFVVAQLGKG